MLSFFAHFLYVLAAWTLVIKFAFPVAMAIAEGSPAGTHIYWDFWWVVHIWLGWSMLNWQRYTWWLGVGVAVVEILIVVIKLWWFLEDPEWTIWQTNWFINKLFVLACFTGVLALFTIRSATLRQRGPAQADGIAR